MGLPRPHLRACPPCCRLTVSKYTRSYLPGSLKRAVNGGHWHWHPWPAGIPRSPRNNLPRDSKRHQYIQKCTPLAACYYQCAVIYRIRELLFEDQSTMLPGYTAASKIPQSIIHGSSNRNNKEGCSKWTSDDHWLHVCNSRQGIYYYRLVEYA